jgi:hypothetical protein
MQNTESKVAAAAFALAAVLAVPGVARAAITFSVTSPAAGAVEGTSLAVNVVVSSTYAVQSASAQVGTVTVSLSAPSSAGQPWTGTLAIGALPYGPATLTLTATDALSNQGSTTVSFVHHNAPDIEVASPIDWVVARPTVSIQATCSDATGCLYQPAGPQTPQPGFEVTFGTQTVTTSQSSLTQNLDLTAYDGQEVDLTFTATNSDSEVTTVTRRVYVDLSARLAQVAVVPGFIFDFDSTRILYRRADDSLVLRDRLSQSESVIGTANSQGDTAPYGVLTSAGAAWISSDASPMCALGTLHAWYWNGGQAMPFGVATCGDVSAQPPATFAGDWALLLPSASSGGNLALTTLNLATGQQVQNAFPFGTGNIEVGTWAIDRSSDVFVPTAGNQGTLVYESRAGTATNIGMVGGSAFSFSNFVVTDGENLVFSVDTTNVGYQINRFSIAAGTSELLGTPMNSPPSPGTYGNYQANNGWVAYVQQSSGVNQVWSESPMGTKTQLSVYNTNSTVDALGPTGEVMFLNGGDSAAGVTSGRYLRIPPALPARINSQLGAAAARCDGWYVQMGGSLFSVTGTQDAGTGCPALDAGVDGSPAADASADGNGGPGADASVDGNGGPGVDAGIDGSTASDAGMKGAKDGGGAPGSPEGGEGSSGEGPRASRGCTVSGPATRLPAWLGGALLLVSALCRGRSRRAA